MKRGNPDYALAVAVQQYVWYSADTDFNTAALSAHLAAGRAAWLLDVFFQSSLAAVFQGGYTWTINQQPVTISDGDLAAGVANPLPLANPGYGIWSWDLSASGDATALARFPDGSPAVVLGNGGRSALLGFRTDTLTEQDGQRFYDNLLDITVNPPPPAIQSFQPPSCVAAVGSRVTVTVPATDADGNLGLDPTDVHSATFSHTYAAAGSYLIVASARDARGAIASRDAECPMLEYEAVPPAIQSFQPPSCVAAVGTPVTVTVPATDADGNLVAESLTWGDGETPNIASFDPTGARKSTFSHTYTDTGLYRIAASARDALGATASSRGADCLMVVYGAADAAKGRGWISSPAGAFKQDASIAGKATFGVRASYLAGATKPTGLVKFSLPNAKLKFKSSSIEWLVLSGPSKAALNGNGTINGEGGYEFLVSIIDGGAKGGGGEDQGQDHQKGFRGHGL